MTTAKESKMTMKTCPYCHAFFLPARRGGKRQRVCGQASCKKALKSDNNALWRRANPGYWHCDYPRVKAWLGRHPGYLKRYRADHPEYVQKNRKAQKERDQR